MNERLNQIHRSIKWEVNQIAKLLDHSKVQELYKAVEELEKMVYEQTVPLDPYTCELFVGDVVEANGDDFILIQTVPACVHAHAYYEIIQVTPLSSYKGKYKSLLVRRSELKLLHRHGATIQPTPA